MSHAPKNNWQPHASRETLIARAKLIAMIRHYFAARNVLEVETPLISHTSVTDPFIESIPVLLQQKTYYLQTSPEYAMKRLLANGSGAIYQISKAFRQDELGRLHNPEFTMLEWYRPGFNHHNLMTEVDELLQLVLKTTASDKISYQQLFLTQLNIDPLIATNEELASVARSHHIDIASEITHRDTWLQILMSEIIEPELGIHKPCFVYDYPASQAALAKLSTEDPRVASRFEVYYHGIELANGFHELQNVNEQRARFEKNLIARNELNLKSLPIDEYFLSALEHGLPDCAGVALGIDRLVMLALQFSEIKPIMSFNLENA